MISHPILRGKTKQNHKPQTTTKKHKADPLSFLHPDGAVAWGEGVFHCSDTDAATGLDDAQRARLTRMLRHGVLHTDMANHAALMRDFRECAAAARDDPNHPWWSDEDATRAMAANGYPHKTQDSLVSAVLHLADISNTARPSPLFHAWARMLQHEFQAQGKREELLGMPVTPMCASPPSNRIERAPRAR